MLALWSQILGTIFSFAFCLFFDTIGQEAFKVQVHFSEGISSTSESSHFHLQKAHFCVSSEKKMRAHDPGAAGLY